MLVFLLMPVTMIHKNTNQWYILVIIFSSNCSEVRLTVECKSARWPTEECQYTDEEYQTPDLRIANARPSIRVYINQELTRLGPA